MTAGIDEAPGYRHGDLVTVAGTPLVVVQHENQWVEAELPDSAVGFTVHQNQIEEPLRFGSLFTGFGGLDQAALAVFGGELAWVCDNHPSAMKLLKHRHPDVPNLGDIAAVDWDQVERVTAVVAGFPCTDISNAGERAGIEGKHSGLWSYVVDAIRVLRPRHVVLENVSALVVRGFDRVISDLAALGYDLRWTCLRASDVGAPHPRDRWFGYATPAADSRRDTRKEEDQDEPSPAGHRAEPFADTDVRRRGAVEPELRWGQSDVDRGVAADAHGDGVREQPVAEPRSGGTTVVVESGPVVDWGQFEPAIRRWEAVTGRPAPAPTVPGRNGPVLNPVFVEWLMGIPSGWVTNVPGLSRVEMLRLLGNGVVPQQGVAALRWLRSLEARCAA